MQVLIIGKIRMWLPRKLYKLNSALEKGLDLTDKVGNSFKYCTKLVGTTTGTCGAAKGNVDLIDAVICQDGVCADCVQVCASFLPGVGNYTTLVTFPVSWGCKTFVWCCKQAKLPWGSCT